MEDINPKVAEILGMLRGIQFTTAEANLLRRMIDLQTRQPQQHHG